MLEILLSSSALILVLAILRLALRGRIDPRLQYALWLLVLVRLLVPVSFFRSPVSVAEAAAPAVERVEAVSDTVVTYRRVFQGTGTPPGADTAEKTEYTRIVPRWTLRDAARIVRLSGTAIVAVWFLFVNLRLARRLRRTRTPYGSDGRLPVYTAPDLPSPCLFGLFRPAVYLTEQAAEEAVQARQIVVHERTHLRHGDLFWALLRSVCLAVWWFNPLVWLAASLSRQDGELACDAGTIKALGEDVRYDYGRTLVGMARAGRAKPSDLLCGATTMTGGKRSLQERIARIARGPGSSLALAVIALLVACAAVGITYAGAAGGDVLPEVTPEPTLEPEITPEPTPEPETAASAADAALTMLGPPDCTIQAPLFADVNYLYPDLYDVILKNIVLTGFTMSFSLDAEPETYGFDFHAWLADGTDVPSSLVTWDREYYDATGNTFYTVYWSEPLDLERVVRIDSFGSALDLPVAPAAFVTDRQLLDFFTDYVTTATVAQNFQTWADYVYFVNDTNRQMAEENYQPFGPGVIYSGEQVNDDLAAFLVWFPSERYPSLQFAGRYEGRLTVFRNESVIPEALREGLDTMTLADPAANDEDILVMVPDYEYLEQVDRELADFAWPREVEVVLAPDYVPEDLDPWTLEDLIYGTDSWEFRYGDSAPANDPRATILVRDGEDRTLYIMDDTDALLIDEGDGTILSVSIPGGSLTGKEMVDRLLAWAESFGDPEAQIAALQAQLDEEDLLLQGALEQLGRFGLPGQDPAHAWAGEEAASWVEDTDPEPPFGPYIFLVYDTPEVWGTDLEYQRLYAWEDGQRKDSIAGDALARTRTYYADYTEVTDVKVGAYDGILTLVDGHAPRLIWYDAGHDLLFSLFVRGRELSSEELIALAETVAPMEWTAPDLTPSEAVFLTITYEGREVDSFLETAGTQIQLDAAVYPEEAAGDVTWHSTDESVAVVDGTGLVTVTGGAGSVCEIVARVGTLETRCTVYGG